jgi:hypothetical protein
MAPRTILYTGKGGVGKTSVAAATARRSAADGARTLVLSTDPAHSLADSLQAEVGSSPTPVSGGLWAQQVQAQEELERHWSAMREWLGGLLAERGVERERAEVAAAFAAEAAYYGAHVSTGRDDATLAVLQRDCAGVFLEAVGADLAADDFAPAYVGALRFELLPGVEAALAGLRGQLEPALDTVARRDYASFQASTSATNPAGLHSHWATLSVGSLPAPALATLVAHGLPLPSVLSEVQIVPLGGRTVVHAVAKWAYPAPSVVAAHRRWADELVDALEPWALPAPDERPLAADPDDVFRAI